MKVLLLTVLVCLVSATEEPLLVQRWAFWGLCRDKSGCGEFATFYPDNQWKFTTIYLASRTVSMMRENSQFWMLMREVKFFKNYTLSMMFYVRKNGKCQLRTVLADKSQFTLCISISHLKAVKCINSSETEFIIGNWVVRDAYLNFSQIYSYPQDQGGIARRPRKFRIVIPFASKTTILLKFQFINDFGNPQMVTAALATGTNMTEEMWKDYVNMTRDYEIRIENIENVYKEDTCPKWEH